MQAQYISSVHFYGCGQLGGSYDCIAFADQATGNLEYFGLGIYRPLEAWLADIAFGREVNPRLTFDSNSTISMRVVCVYNPEFDVAMIRAHDTRLVIADATAKMGVMRTDDARRQARL